MRLTHRKEDIKMDRKRINGEGSISYDSRRKSYRTKITIGWKIDEKYNFF